MTDHAFRTFALHRIFAVPFAGNEPSIRVLEKAAYTREGVMRASALKDGRLLDQVLFATIRT